MINEELNLEMLPKVIIWDAFKETLNLNLYYYFYKFVDICIGRW